VPRRRSLHRLGVVLVEWRFVTDAGFSGMIAGDLTILPETKENSMRGASKTRARAKTSKASKKTMAVQASCFHPFVAPLSPDMKLDSGAFQRALKIGGRYKVDLSSADAILAGAGDADNWGEEIAEGFRLLEKVMRASLSELSVAFARANGVVRVRMWLFGRSDDGSLVGLRSMSTET
jgi:hypothetical protein